MNWNTCRWCGHGHKKCTCKFAALVIAFMLFSATPVRAAEVTANGGWQHTSNSNYTDNAVVNTRVEQTVVETKYGKLNAAIDGGYHGPTDHRTDSNASYGSVHGWSLLGDLVYYPPVKWKVRPYLLGGLGWSWWDFSAGEEVSSRNISVDLGDSFAKKVGFGADYRINDRWSINLEWYYFQSHVPKDARHADGSPSAVLGDDDRKGRTTIGQEETNLVVGLKYRF